MSMYDPDDGLHHPTSGQPQPFEAFLAAMPPPRVCLRPPMPKRDDLVEVKGQMWAAWFGEPDVRGVRL